MKVCIGGTFNVLHKGHKVLIDKAIRIAGKQGYLFIGLTKGEIFRTKKNIKPYNYRKQNVLNYLKEKDDLPKIEIKSIIDKYGPSIDKNFDVIIVSPETKKTANEINKKRINIGKKPLKVIQIPYVFADNGKPISSSRILKNEINTNGKILILF